MPTLRPVVETHFLSIANEAGSFAHAGDYTGVAFRGKSTPLRGGPTGTWVEAGTTQIASIPVFGVVLSSDVTSYGTGAAAKKLDVSFVSTTFLFLFFLFFCGGGLRMCL